MDINEIPAFLESYNTRLCENPVFAGDRWSIEILFATPEPFRLMHHGRSCTYAARMAPTLAALIEKMQKDLDPTS